MIDWIGYGWMAGSVSGPDTHFADLGIFARARRRASRARPPLTCASTACSKTARTP